MKYDVCLEGAFCTDFVIEAETPEEADRLARSKLDSQILLSGEDFIISSSTVTGNAE